MKQVIASLVMLTVLHGWGIQPAAAADQKKLAVPIQRLAIQEISSLTLNPISVTGGAMVTGTLALKVPAPSAGLKVTFKSSKPAIAAVPSGTVVQAGATSATFIVQTYPVVVNPNVVADPPSVQISAQIENSAPKIVKLTVLPPTLTALTLNPTNVAGGNNSTGTVTISGPAPSGGLVIPLSSKPTSPTAAPMAPPGTGQTPRGIGQTPSAPSQPRVSMPSQVTIAASATSATFAITTTPVSASATFQVNATWGVYLTRTATLTLTSPALDKITPDISEPIGGTVDPATVSITAPAPQEGLLYNVHLSPDFFCGTLPTVPPTVQIPGGATSATFPITTYPGFGTTIVAVSAGGQYKSIHFGVHAPIIDENSLQFPSSVQGGTTVQAKLHLNGAAMPLNCNSGYKLQSSNTQLARVPDTVTVTPGQTDAPFSITTSSVPSAQNVVITVFGPTDPPVYPLGSMQKTLALTP